VIQLVYHTLRLSSTMKKQRNIRKFRRKQLAQESDLQASVCGPQYQTLVFSIFPCMAVMFILQNQSLSNFWRLVATAIDINSNSCIN